MKCFAGLFTALVVTMAGLVVAPAANADPYPHSIATYCHAKAKTNPIPTTVRPRFIFWITTDGNGVPHTNVHITIKRKSTGHVVRRTTRWYDGGKPTWAFKKLHNPGRYKFILRTATGANSVYKNCSVSRVLRVTR